MKSNTSHPIVTMFTLLLSGLAAIFLSSCGESSSPEVAAVPATPAPFTGQIHEVKMRGTKEGYSFQPNQVLIKSGDKVRFTMVEGGPHNVSFNNQKIPAGASVALENEGKLVGALLQAPSQTYDLWFTKDMPTGEYNFVCDPHNALGMKGKVIVSK